MKPKKILIIDESIREIERLVKESEKEGYITNGSMKVTGGIYFQDMILKTEIH